MKAKRIRTIQFLFWMLVAISIILVPLKIWRAGILVEKDVAYFPGSLSVAIKLTDHQTDEFRKNGFDLAQIKSEQKFGPNRESSLESAENRDDYWKFSTVQLVAKGVVDRVDDISFLNTLAVTWCVYCFALVLAARFPNAKPDDSPNEALATNAFSPWRVWLGLLVGIGYTGANWWDHYEEDHGPIHGAFWVTDRDHFGLVWLTQQIDATLFLITAAIAGVSLIAAWTFQRELRFGDSNAAPSESKLLAYECLCNITTIPLVAAVFPLFIAVTYSITKEFFAEVFNPWSPLNALFFFLLYWVPFILVAFTILVDISRYNHRQRARGNKTRIQVKFSFFQKLIIPVWISFSRVASTKEPG